MIKYLNKKIYRAVDAPWLTEFLPGLHKALGQTPSSVQRPGVVAKICGTSTQEAGGSKLKVMLSAEEQVQSMLGMCEVLFQKEEGEKEGREGGKVGGREGEERLGRKEGDSEEERRRDCEKKGKESRKKGWEKERERQGSTKRSRTRDTKSRGFGESSQSQKSKEPFIVFYLSKIKTKNL